MPETRADLGQFFTPRPVVEFALQLLADRGARIDGSVVCDPACGPGEWLSAALRAGVSTTVGIDCDPAMVPRWQATGLAADPGCRLVVADGLSAAVDELAAADIVVGNPPFGAELSDLRRKALVELARRYRLLELSANPGDLSAADLDRIRRFPSEVLFLERFVRLCRPGGWIAIVLPHGIFANRRWRRVRSWMLAQLTVHIVAGLPRGTFRTGGTTAQTCLMVARRQQPSPGHEITLCALEEASYDALRGLREALLSGRAEEPLDLTPPIFL